LPDATHIALLALLPVMIASPVVGGLLLRQRHSLALLWFILLAVLFTVGIVWGIGPLLLGVAGLMALALLAIIFGD